MRVRTQREAGIMVSQVLAERLDALPRVKGPRTARAGPLGPAPLRLRRQGRAPGAAASYGPEPRPERTQPRRERASGGGAQAPRWRGHRSRVPADSGVRGGAPIPPAVDPGRAEQTRPMASRSFVQWRAPPGRHEPRPLHGVWVDGGRDGSWEGLWLRRLIGCGTGFDLTTGNAHVMGLIVRGVSIPGWVTPGVRASCARSRQTKPRGIPAPSLWPPAQENTAGM